jgi:hypothetical protein
LCLRGIHKLDMHTKAAQKWGKIWGFAWRKVMK